MGNGDADAVRRSSPASPSQPQASMTYAGGQTVQPSMAADRTTTPVVHTRSLAVQGRHARDGCKKRADEPKDDCQLCPGFSMSLSPVTATPPPPASQAPSYQCSHLTRALRSGTLYTVGVSVLAVSHTGPLSVAVADYTHHVALLLSS